MYSLFNGVFANDKNSGVKEIWQELYLFHHFGEKFSAGVLFNNLYSFQFGNYDWFIEGELKYEVAKQTKLAADTLAAQLLSVAELSKKTLLMEASAKFEQAEIMAATALETKKAMIAQAEGKKEAGEGKKDSDKK